MFPPLPLNSAAIQTIEWQSASATELVDTLSIKRGALLRGGTGLGKMFITCDTLRQMALAGKLTVPEGSVNPFPILWLCPKSVKAQTQRVLRDYGLTHLTMLMSYGQIKNKDGTDIFLSYVTVDSGGPIPDIIPRWFDGMLPAIIVCDESHKLKNPESLISTVVRHVPASVKMLFTTATPFQRVVDGRYLVEGCSVVTKYNMLPATLTTSPAILREIAYPKDTAEYSPTATQRLREALEPYIVELKNVKFKHPTKTVCSTIYFATSEERRIYEDAYNEYLRVLRQKRGDFSGHGRMAILVAMRKFQQKAELLRCPQIADRCVKAVAADKQVIVASNYLDTLRSVWTRLVKQHGVLPERISYIVGGQNERTRQEMIDKFQRGDSDYCLFTMTSGGVGISLHHDRPTTKPRYIVLPPTWSAIDLVQALGRGHRLTSLSPTVQEILWYGDTIEDKVKLVVERKVKCLSKAITAKEQFIGLFERETADELDDETNEEYNKIMAADSDAESNGDIDSQDESFTGEGLDSDDTLPTSYR